MCLSGTTNALTLIISETNELDGVIVVSGAESQISRSSRSRAQTTLVLTFSFMFLAIVLTACGSRERTTRGGTSSGQSTFPNTGNQNQNQNGNGVSAIPPQHWNVIKGNHGGEIIYDDLGEILTQDYNFQITERTQNGLVYAWLGFDTDSGPIMDEQSWDTLLQYAGSFEDWETGSLIYTFVTQILDIGEFQISRGYYLVEMAVSAAGQSVTFNPSRSQILVMDCDLTDQFCTGGTASVALTVTH